MKKIVLIDAHAVIHRAYHALPDFMTKSGFPTGALYGVSTMLLSIFDEIKPDYVLATFDLPKPTFRHIAYEDYKGTRKKTDEDLILQIKKSYEIFEAFHIPTLYKEGFEADDILGTLAEKLKSNNRKIFIATGDMDTLQLVDDEKVVVYTLKKGNNTIIYNEKEVIKKYGFGPKMVVDFKALSGDNSDNIPGIPGVGIKTATNLILNFGNLDNIYKIIENHSDNEIKEKHKIGKITPRIIKLLKEHKEEAYFSYELAKIITDVDIKIPELRENFQEQINLEKIEKIFDELEFRNLKKRVQKIFGLEIEEEIFNESELDQNLLKKLKIGVSLLNSKNTDPSLEDILRYNK